MAEQLHAEAHRAGVLYRQSGGGFAVYAELSSGYPARPDAFFLKAQNFCKKYLTKGGKNDNIFFVLSTSYADVAQLAEQLTCNQQVIGSSPIIGFFLAYLQEKNLILFKLR